MQPQMPTAVIKNTQLIFGNPSKLSSEERQAITDLKDMPQQDVEKVIKEMEKVLMTAKYRDAEGNFIDPSLKEIDGPKQQ
jgi:hypothetical protein